MQHILEVSHIEKSHGKNPVLKGLSFAVNAGEIVGLLGANGAGKSTTFRIIMGVFPPDSGQIFLNGESLSNLPIDQRAKLGIGYLSQEPSLFQSLSVEENLLCILELLVLSKEKRKEKLENLLDELNIKHLRKKKAKDLSGGEKRRLEITRTLIRDPKVILLDEPFANIDPLSIEEVKSLMKTLAKKNIGILITDHNARELLSLVDRCVLMQNGQSLFSGTAKELIENREAKRSYLGEAFTL